MSDLRAFACELAERPRIRAEVRPVQRIDGDCLRVAVAEAYGLSYTDTPPVSGYDAEQQSTWQTWAAARGLRWWCSFEFAPVHLDAWIGHVPSLDGPGYHHAIAFGGEEPRGLRDGSNFADASIADVREAKWLLPAGVAMPPGRLRRIEHRQAGKPGGVHYQAPYEDGSGSTWVQAPVA